MAYYEGDRVNEDILQFEDKLMTDLAEIRDESEPKL